MTMSISAFVVLFVARKSCILRNGSASTLIDLTNLPSASSRVRKFAFSNDRGITGCLDTAMWVCRFSIRRLAVAFVHITTGLAIKNSSMFL